MVHVNGKRSQGTDIGVTSHILVTFIIYLLRLLVID